VATAGDCIALAAGTYTGASLDGSVSVLGAGSAQTTVQGAAGRTALTLAGGGASLVRGVRLTGPAGGLSLQDVTGVTVESTAVTGGAAYAVQTIDATAVTLRHVLIADISSTQDASSIGIYALRSPGLTVVHSLVQRVAGPGLVADGGDADVTESVIRDNRSYGVSGWCSDLLCPSPPLIVVQDCLVDRNGGVGIWMMRVRARLTRNTVTRTGWVGKLSRGIETHLTADLEIAGNTVDQGQDYGILITRANASLSGNLIAGNGGRGLWIQNLQSSESLVLDLVDNEIDGNHQTGLGVNGVCSLNLVGGAIRNTILTPVLINDDYGISVGDGLEALPGSDLQVAGVTFEGNERAAILADQVTGFQLTDSRFDRATQAYTVVVYNTDAADIHAAGNLAFDDSPVLPNEMMPPDPIDYDPAEVLAAETAGQ
jgi:hypothetical protein